MTSRELVAEESRAVSDALVETQVALSRAQRLSELGALAAAAAHELGSPLATIAVVAKEMARDVPKDSPMAADVALLIAAHAVVPARQAAGRPPDAHSVAFHTRQAVRRAHVHHAVRVLRQADGLEAAVVAKRAAAVLAQSGTARAEP